MTKKDSTVAAVVHEIPLAEIHVSASAAQAARRAGALDPDGIRGLADSIEASGLLQPLVVRPRPRRDEDEVPTLEPPWELVAGERRLAALRLLGRERAPCLVAEGDDRETLTRQLVENVQREGLDPFAEAAGYRELVDAGLTTTEIAARVGRGETTVRGRLALLSLHEDARSALEAGRIVMSVAELIARWPADLQPGLLDAATPSAWSDRETLPLDRARLALLEAHSIKIAAGDFDPKRHPDAAQPRAPSCDRCPARGSGRGEMGGGTCLDVACWGRLQMEHCKSRVAALAERGGRVATHIVKHHERRWVATDDRFVDLGRGHYGSPAEIIGADRLADVPKTTVIALDHSGHPRVESRWERKALVAAVPKGKATVEETESARRRKRWQREARLWIELAAEMERGGHAPDMDALLERVGRGAGAEARKLFKEAAEGRGIGASALLAAVPLLPADEWTGGARATDRLVNAAKSLGVEMPK